MATFAGHPPAGTLKYNGIEFSGASHITVETDFIRDEAERVVLYHRYMITVTAVLAGQTTDASMQDIRDKLGKDGGTLIFAGFGFGLDLSARTDVDNGPKVEILSWEPVGGANACTVEWRVSTCVLPCSASQRSSGVLAINYAASFDIDEHGDTTRTITGYLQIIQNITSQQISDTADAYRDMVKVEVPEGFERRQSWRLDLAKKRLEFNITDHEIPSPNPYPRDMTAISATHRARWARGAVNQNTLTVNVRPRAGLSPERGWLAALTIFRKRVQAAKDAGADYIFIDLVDAEEGIYSRNQSYTFGYRTTGDPGDFLGKTGLWSPVNSPGGWKAWRTSIATQQSNRGTARLTHDVQMDAVIDPCTGGGEVVNEEEPAKPRVGGVRSLALKNDCPAAENSWIGYRAKVVVKRNDGVIRQRILQAPPATDPWAGNLDSTQSLAFPETEGLEDVIQYSGQSSYKVIFVGYAQRICHEIPRPRLATIAGQVPVETDGHFETESLGVFLGQTLYQAQWRIEYVLPKSPTTVTPPERLDYRPTGGSSLIP